MRLQLEVKGQIKNVRLKGTWKMAKVGLRGHGALCGSKWIIGDNQIAIRLWPPSIVGIRPDIKHWSLLLAAGL